MGGDVEGNKKTDEAKRPRTTLAAVSISFNLFILSIHSLTKVTGSGPGGSLSRAERHQLRQAGLSKAALADLAPMPLRHLPLGRLQTLRWVVFRPQPDTNRRREKKRKKSKKMMKLIILMKRSI
ncbi:hypothetical protein MKX08_008830 [Trichoderma sp. CBMAI-0020]|nr:hypothetical protein MKX08_008830 [Trichoderma sp. CBMAI-0020]